MVQLSVKSSVVSPLEKPTLVEEDLDVVLEGRPWLFNKQLILFDRLLEPIERSFCFGCGQLGYILRDCCFVTEKIKNLLEDEVTFSLALKAELNFVGKVALLLNLARKKRMEQCSHLGEKELRVFTIDDRKPVIPRSVTKDEISSGKSSGKK
ncbi:hypothetical protein Gorai_019798 [Gossypium raimondii]|uniref:CCHC-type domain-containing protein n=1 Tax=Gossypium raimondii TaxID=29730 RepID=A0A7J8PPV1_GOSRA|nr:hypothetical protein [Gossypium raimondii]